jgi:hypothetical protein
MLAPLGLVSGISKMTFFSAAFLKTPAIQSKNI